MNKRGSLRVRVENYIQSNPNTPALKVAEQVGASYSYVAGLKKALNGKIKSQKNESQLPLSSLISSNRKDKALIKQSSVSINISGDYSLISNFMKYHEAEVEKEKINRSVDEWCSLLGEEITLAAATLSQENKKELHQYLIEAIKELEEK